MCMTVVQCVICNVHGSSKVHMVVLRDESCVTNENGTVSADTSNIMDTFDVELVKKPGKGLGLSIVGRKAGSGIFISSIVSIVVFYYFFFFNDKDDCERFLPVGGWRCGRRRRSSYERRSDSVG